MDQRYLKRVRSYLQLLLFSIGFLTKHFLACTYKNYSLLIILLYIHTFELL